MRHRPVLVLAAIVALLVPLGATAVGAAEPDGPGTSTSTSTSASASTSASGPTPTPSGPASSTPTSSVPTTGFGSAAEDTETTTEDPATTTTTAAIAPDGVVDTTGGNLVWGVRSSFVNYIKGPIAHGSITVTGGTVDNTATDGTFTFPGLPGGTFDGATNDTTAAFAGSVRFTGHDNGQGPELDLKLENLEILRDSTGSWLVADVTSVPFHGTSSGGGAPEAPVAYPDLKVASLATDGVLPVSTPPDGLTWYDLDAVLTEEAVPAFGLYAAGEVMDPVTYTLTFDEVPDVVVDPIGPVAPVVTLDKYTVTAGDTLTASGPEFTPGEQVEVWLHSTPAWVATATADASGLVTITFVVPLDTPAGLHQIELRGISSGDSITSADFTVIAAATATTTGQGTLPRTGSDGRIAVAGVVLVGLGGALTAVARRRAGARPSL